ncbi:MAG: hypothetical protein ACTSPB_19110 [Candidatus Thorarchaeota archaeon]
MANAEYNQDWCNERHERIDEEFNQVWKRIKTVDSRLWAILVVQLVILGGIVGTLLKL